MNKLTVVPLLFAASLFGQTPVPAISVADPAAVDGRDKSADISGRLFASRPVASGGVLEKMTVESGDLSKLPALPENVPFNYNPLQKTARSDGFCDTVLSINQTYRANYSTLWGQLLSSSTPVYYDQRILLLSPDDKKLLAQDQQELGDVIDQLQALTERAEHLSKDLNAIYARGRPFKVLKNLTTENTYEGPDTIDKGNPVVIPLQNVAASIIAPESQLKK